MENSDKKPAENLSAAEQELMAEAELQHFQKRQRLIQCAYGRKPRWLRVLTGIFYCTANLMLIAGFLIFKHSEYISYGCTLLVVMAAVQIHFQYIDRRINALLELLEEERPDKLKTPAVHP